MRPTNHEMERSGIGPMLALFIVAMTAWLVFVTVAQGQSLGRMEPETYEHAQAVAAVQTGGEVA